MLLQLIDFCGFAPACWSPPRAVCKLHAAKESALASLWRVRARRRFWHGGLGMAVRSLQHSSLTSAPPPNGGGAAAQAMAQQAAQLPPQAMPFDGYGVEGFHDEMFFPGGEPRPCCQPLFERVQRL